MSRIINVRDLRINESEPVKSLDYVGIIAPKSIKKNLFKKIKKFEKKFLTE